ncbi:hypothetical protein BJ878DRAFT_305730 [Calycina marina]|uniref:Rhodopsin domain-containing protein n=1 Tax=Calycina marina TaxID=1763456 RepID=A0A9P7YUX2_9HELO|nr:hypothetical protein BJ878DRAFT_305730 [Calycina marina]
MDPPKHTVVLSTGISRLAVNAVVATSVLTALADLLAGIRFYIRRRAGLGADDYILMAAMVFLQLQLAFCFMIGFLSGSGWEMIDLAADPVKLEWTLKLIYFPELSYTVVTTLMKTSILYSYKTIFGRVKSTRYHIYFLLGLSWAWGVAMFLTIVFQCSPINKAWIPQKSGHCIPTVSFLWGNSITNFIIDWMILLVPVVPVLKLQLPPTQKSLVIMSFLVGSLACIASTIRSAKTSTFDPSNLGISDYNASIWVYIETPLATISCCLPFLSRMFGSKVTGMFTSITSRLSSKKSGSYPSQGSILNGSRGKSQRLSGGSALSSPGEGQRSFSDEHERRPKYQQIKMTTTASVDSRSVKGEDVELGYRTHIIAPAPVSPRPVDMV